MSARVYNAVGTRVTPDGFPLALVDMPGGGTLLDGAVTDDTDGQLFISDGSWDFAAVGIRYTDDGIIPSNSSVNSVAVFSRTQRTVGANPIFMFAYARLDGVATFGLPFSGNLGVWKPHTDTFNHNPDFNPWTVDTIWQASVGLSFRNTGVPAGHLAIWVWTYITVNFDLPPPVITTGIATGITLVQATLQGTINPNFANATYPCAYYFEYGPTTAYGAVTATVNNLTGSADIAATGTAVDLTPSTDYHFRLVGTNADHTINGADGTFRTRALPFPFWQDEFHPTDGTLDTKALVRWESVGFDLASDILDCPILDRDAE